MPYRRSSYVRTSQTGTFSVSGKGTLVKRKVGQTVTPPPPPPPPPCESSALHAGEEGWTYDGCNWSYTNPCEDAGLHEEGVDGWTYDGCHWTQSTGGCPEGEFWNGFNCTGDADGGCPEGYYWDGSICQPVEDPPPEE